MNASRMSNIDTGTQILAHPACSLVGNVDAIGLFAHGQFVRGQFPQIGQPKVRLG